MSKLQQLVFWTTFLFLVATGCSTHQVRQITPQTATLIPTEALTPSSVGTDSPIITITPLLSQTSESTNSLAEMFSADEYILETAITINEPRRYYQIQSWDNSTSDWIADNIISISNGPFETILIKYARLGELPKADITGEGDPDVLIYGWGARLANPVYIYNLGEELTRVFRSYRSSCSRPSGCDFEMFDFKDLNYDGIPEIITYDTALNRFDCGPSLGPMPLIVYAYDSELMQYNIVSPLYPEIYSEIIATLTELAEKSPEYKCVVSDLVMNYLYSGQIEKGWSELDRIYQGDDSEAFREEMENLLQFKYERERFILLEDLDER